MDAPSEGSINRCFYNNSIQGFKQIENIQLSIGKDSNKNIAENFGRFSARHDSMSAGNYVQKEILAEKTETITMQQESARDDRETTVNRQIVELGDNFELQRQLAEIKNECKNLSLENTGMLIRLIPDAKRGERSREEYNSDKELTETISSSSESSQTFASVKMKRTTRTARNKTHETVKVRRNPMRASKKDIDKDFPRPRQRLLANSSNYESGKRTRTSTRSYMNTRSVTRKMYNVGATYQAPTKKDETVYKDWPVHGMHERPVYHPQAGLAVEYLGKYFTSVDESYREIVNEPEIEVVAVDPDRDRLSSAEKKKRGKAKQKSKRSSSIKEILSAETLSEENQSFETYMHGSLHYLLGYCSQVMTPYYKQVVENKMTKSQPTVSAARINASEPIKEGTSFKDNAMISSEMTNYNKFAEKVKLLEGYAIAMAQSAQNKSENARDRRIASSNIASSSAGYVSKVQQIDSSKTILQNNRINLPIVRNFPNASLVLLTNSSARTSDEVCKTKDANNVCKLSNDGDATIDDKTSSIYKRISTNEPVLNREETLTRENMCTFKKYAANTREYNAKKIALEDQFQNPRTIPVVKETDEKVNETMKRSDNVTSVTTSVTNRNAACTVENSEIAKILSEYNRNVTKKSTIQIYGSASRNLKANIAGNPGVKNLTKTTFRWPKDIEAAEENRNVLINRNVNRSADLDFSQGKWRKLPLEEMKNIQVIGGNQIAWNNSLASSTNCQQSLEDRQMAVNALNCRKEKPVVVRKDFHKQREIIVAETKSKEATLESFKGETKSLNTEDSLQELLQNTSLLYCAASGVHQDDLSNYIDTLDNQQSIQWLED